MQDSKNDSTQIPANLETLTGIVERITFHSPESGWSVLKVSSFARRGDVVTVVVHQCKVFAGATLQFHGFWLNHPKYGEQFKALKVVEQKPASAGALEKYLGSGLIFGVGPKTAKKIVKHFGGQTLDVFETKIDALMQVPGIAELKLKQIKSAWQEHRDIREVMLFLQNYDISTLFAVKIYKTYGNKSVDVLKENPYRLAKDIYGIGFFSADKVAQSIGIALDSDIRIGAAIKHVLAAAREEGHCYLTKEQIQEEVNELLALDLNEKISGILNELETSDELKTRELYIYKNGEGARHKCYYSKTLFFEEFFVAKKVKEISSQEIKIEEERVESWVERYCEAKQLTLSSEQKASVVGVAGKPFSILTGGPGCGKTTTTNVLVKLLLAMKKRLLLAAPTGRAAQRMSEVIGLEAKTIHRLLEWKPQSASFEKNENNPFDTDFLIVDECSMLDVSIAAALLKAVPANCQVLFIGDADQLPSVGAGNVFKDLIDSKVVSVFKLTEIFRQAKNSFIVRYAHEINKGVLPELPSPFEEPDVWAKGVDCLFVDSDELTQEQAKFIAKAKHVLKEAQESHCGNDAFVEREGKKGAKLFEKIEFSNEGELQIQNLSALELKEMIQEPKFVIPKKFQHVDWNAIHDAQEEIDELKALLKKIHPYSSLHYGLNASQTVRKFYQEVIPKYFGKKVDIQILSPMTRGSLGTVQLNKLIQESVNPWHEGKSQVQLGERVFRVGDRVIQKRNNYDLGVFNGDIGIIRDIDNQDFKCLVEFNEGKNSAHEVCYEREHLNELDLAYAITIHKSQGSEFDAVIIPVMTQHYKMLFRNLIYTGLTRGKKLAVFVGTRKALNLAVYNIDSRTRQTALKDILKSM